MQQAMSVLTSHESAEWYTPPEYVALAREVLGDIDLDPASNPVAQEWIQARTYWTVADGALDRQWLARSVWLNPPYGIVNGKSAQAVWSAKLAHEYRLGHVEHAILLVNTTHGYRWYEELWRRFDCCLATERIRFVRPDGTQGGAAKRGQTFVYFGIGEGRERFRRVFSSVGRVIAAEAV